MIRTACTILALTAATACVSSSGPAAAPPPPCTAAPAALLDGVAGGAETDVGTLTLTHGQLLPHAGTYLVAARIGGPGLDGHDVGVWATSQPEGGALVLAVDGYAKRLTVWPDADKTPARIGAGDPDVQAVAWCAAH